MKQVFLFFTQMRQVKIVIYKIQQIKVDYIAFVFWTKKLSFQLNLNQKVRCNVSLIKIGSNKKELC